MIEVKEYLLNNEDKNYLELNKKLNIGLNRKCIGVRLPIIKNYAKTLLKKYSFSELVENIDEEYYEEVLLKGFIIGLSKLTYKELIKYLDYYLPKITDWSICDSFTSSLKITTKYLNELWPYLLKKLNSKKEFEIRFSLVMILNYYICDDYKNRIYEIISKVNLDSYYVKMANAWLISYMFINYFSDTVNFIKNTQIDEFTTLKGITKAIESRLISKDQKDNLRLLRSYVKNKYKNI